VIEPHQPQHRRMKIVDVNRVFRGPKAKLIGRAMDVPAFDAPTASQTVNP